MYSNILTKMQAPIKVQRPGELSVVVFIFKYTGLTVAHVDLYIICLYTNKSTFQKRVIFQIYITVYYCSQYMEPDQLISYFAAGHKGSIDKDRACVFVFVFNTGPYFYHGK